MFESVLGKNPDMEVLRGLSGDKLALYKYLPLNSVDCERIFRLQ